MSIVDAYVNALDDFIDLECVDCIRGRGAGALYVHTILSTNMIVASKKARYFPGRNRST